MEEFKVGDIVLHEFTNNKRIYLILSREFERFAEEYCYKLLILLSEGTFSRWNKIGKILYLVDYDLQKAKKVN